MAKENNAEFVAEASSELIGESSLYGSRGLVEVGMAVETAWRGKGVGSALMEAGIAWARSKEFDKIALQVFPHNEAALKLYEKYGFVREGYLVRHRRRNTGEVWDLIQMGLVLE